ncbi:MAG: cupin domain-containing protein [Porticoccaceae bacterium]|nr:cupin domain-containing protein [Porticoccaceae bacterium]
MNTLRHSLFLFACFFALPPWNHGAETQATIDYDVLLQSNTSWDGAPLPQYGSGNPEIAIVKVVIPPGMTLSTHQHPVINAAVILSGEITVTSERGDILHLKAGDAVAELVNTWHHGKNEGAEPTVILVFYAGEKGKPLSIKKQP